MRISPVAMVAGTIILSGALWSRVIAPALELMLRIAQSIVLAVLVIAVACIVVRWILPVALEILTGPLQDGIAVVVGLLLLPEYLLTTIMRRMGKSPLQIAYDFGDVLAWMARTLCAAVRIIFNRLARAARIVHPIIVAVISGGLTLGLTLGQL